MCTGETGGQVFTYILLQGGPKKTSIFFEGPPNFFLLSKCNGKSPRPSLNLFLQVPEKFLEFGNRLFGSEQISSEIHIKSHAFPFLTDNFGLLNRALNQNIWSSELQVM